MNERIDELMYRAGLTAQGCWDEMDAYDRKAIMTLAELIVKECAKITDDVCESSCFGIGINGAMLKEHFGVQE
jgi:hypothetical protein